jgi:UDP-N-acetylmuramoyl-L-alanyl-D-glutamate--2,6-diaminopimelate ligase
MRLAELTAIEALRARCAPASADSLEITSLAYDSRRVQPGALFFCVPGLKSDGHRFAPQAIAAGAAALVVERALHLGVPEVQVDSVRACMGPMAARFYGDPSAQLRVVGVTGTNGKTTTAYLVRALMQASGRQCALLGTVKSVIAGCERPAVRTTPEAIDLQADLRAMLDGGDSACAMEVSSHALALGRTDCVRFAAAIFTNLTQDHLDFHDTMEDYFQAKRRLFMPSDDEWDGTHRGERAARERAILRRSPPGVSVVNAGDPYGRRLAQEIDGPLLTFAVEADADYSAREVHSDFGGSRFQLHTPQGTHDLTLPLPGSFNVANALGALAATHTLGGELPALIRALERGVAVPGRFQSIDEGQDFAVIVDYAHTPDSLENVLIAARELASPQHGRVLCVFGAGGDRDRGKRPLMGAAVAALADVAIVTSDNPRSEDPQAIVQEVVAGVEQGQVGVEQGQGRVEQGEAEVEQGQGGVEQGEVEVELDRRDAIELAVRRARTGDVLVIAGKGHEQGQEFAGGRKIPFDDASVAREALAVRVGCR